MIFEVIPIIKKESQDCKKEYKVIDNSETEFTFGSQNTIFAEDLTEEEKNSVIVASVEDKPYAIIDKNQTYYME